jgi:Acyl-CoA dehydrogenase, C-terminal domain
MAKLFASQTAVHVTDEAIQILGGNGYTRDYPVERMHRDSKIFTIFVAAFGEIGRAWETTCDDANPLRWEVSGCFGALADSSRTGGTGRADTSAATVAAIASMRAGA